MLLDQERRTRLPNFQRNLIVDRAFRTTNTYAYKEHPHEPKIPCHPGRPVGAIRDPGAARTAILHPLGPGSQRYALRPG
nr:hypothetical protein EUX21_03020 [synthetic Caulobacter sp. 'ethensis']